MTNRDTRKRVLALGYGLMGASLARIIDNSGWARIVGVVDTSADALERAHDQHQLPEGATGDKLQAMLRDTRPDIVSINTPSEKHYRQVIASLNAGCHVLVAKPIASSLSEALRIVEHAQAC